MSWFSHGYHGKRHCSWARTHDNDDNNGVAQNGGNTPNNRLPVTYSLYLPCTSLILDVHAMINWHLSKQSIRWPVLRGHIASSSLELIEVTYFFEVYRWSSARFPIGSRAHVRLTCWKHEKVRKGQRTNQKYRNLVGSDKQMQKLENKLNLEKLTVRLGFTTIIS